MRKIEGFWQLYYWELEDLEKNDKGRNQIWKK